MSHSNTPIAGSVSTHTLSQNPCSEIVLGQPMWDIFSVNHWLYGLVGPTVGFSFNIDGTDCRVTIDFIEGSSNVYLPFKDGGLKIVLINKEPPPFREATQC